MYLDLDRLDVRAEDELGPLGVQTDHRDAEQIMSQPELSAIMMLARVLNPQRGQDPLQRVRLAMAHSPPPWFTALACAAGAEVEDAGSGHTEPSAPDPEGMLAAASSALVALGEATFARNGAPVSAAGLERLQHLVGVRVGALGGKDDKEAYWQGVLELGAATGLLLIREHGHRWAPDPDFFGTIPFMCAKGESLSNVFDKVERFFRDGPSEAPTFLLSLAHDAALPDGQVMFNLRPPDWQGRGLASCEPILEVEGTPVPLLALVHDTPNSVRSIRPDLPPEELAELKAQARANLAQIPFELQELDLQGNPALVLEGDYYAAEKLWDRDFALELHARLGSEVLLVGIPAKGQALVLPKSVDPGFGLALVQRQYQSTEPRNRISALLFVFQEGELVGLARNPEESEPSPEPPKRGFFARLFGGD